MAIHFYNVENGIQGIPHVDVLVWTIVTNVSSLSSLRLILQLIIIWETKKEGLKIQSIYFHI